jgi:hypothetical protein
MMPASALNLRQKDPFAFSRYWGSFLALILAAPLTAYIFMGTFIRLIGDDYCYAWILGQNGFWKAQIVSYLKVSMYNGNRYSLSLFSFLADLFKPAVNGWLPGLVILLFVLGLTLVLWQAARLANVTIHWLFILVGAEFLCLMTLSQAPDLYQILYWRTGMLTYLAPVIANTFLLALILWQWKTDHPSYLAAAAAFILALCAGGFSETGFALQITTLVMLSAGYALCTKRNQRKERWNWWIFLSALLGTILAGLLLALSPTNQARLGDLPPRPDWIYLIQSTIQNVRIFSAITLKTLFIPTLIGFFVPLGASILFFTSQLPQTTVKVKVQAVLIRLGLELVLGFILLFACFLPSAYIQSSYPGLRALIPARFVMVLIIATAGWLMGQVVVILFRQVFSASGVQWAVTICILGMTVLYSIWTFPKILAEQPKFTRWALLWDERDLSIRKASKQNIKNLEVMQLDHLIPDVGELDPDPGYWYNQCAAGYYEVDSISANQPGWDQ